MKKIVWFFIGLILVGGGCARKIEIKTTAQSTTASLAPTRIKPRIEIVSRVVLSDEKPLKEDKNEAVAESWTGFLATERLTKIPADFFSLKKFQRGRNLEVYGFTVRPGGEIGAFYGVSPEEKNLSKKQLFLVIKDTAGSFALVDANKPSDTIGNKFIKIGQARVMDGDAIPQLIFSVDGKFLTTGVEIYKINRTKNTTNDDLIWSITPVVDYAGDGYFGNTVFSTASDMALARRQGFGENGSSDRTENILRLINLTGDGINRELFSQIAEHPLNLDAIGFSADNKWALTIENGVLAAYLLNGTDRQVLITSDYLKSVSWKPNNGILRLLKTNGSIEEMALRFYDENGQVSQTVPSLLVPPIVESSSTIVSATSTAVKKSVPSGIETWGQWSHPIYKFSFQLPLGVAAQMTSNTDAVFQDPATKTIYANLQIAKNIPSVPLAPQKITTLKLDGVDAKIFHNTAAKDGKTKIDQLWVKIPQTNMVLFFQSPVAQQENFDFYTILSTWQWNK